MSGLHIDHWTGSNNLGFKMTNLQWNIVFDKVTYGKYTLHQNMHTSLLKSMQKAWVNCLNTHNDKSHIHPTIFSEILKCAAIFPIRQRDIRSHQIQNILENLTTVIRVALLKCFSAENTNKVVFKLYNTSMVGVVCI